ncbi:MAG: ABC transporter substrate-binding protein [Chthoniobacter sp.]|uniref:ABC transporter substrate-binding protein n=1 Tax=Chthoniobacter sp. TaxID=2510640 RepID=UPI0032A3260B
MPPFRALALLFLPLAALIFTGCDNDPNPPPYHKTRADGSPWRARYMGIPYDPKSFDPQFAYDTTSQQFLEPVYDRLLDYHPIKSDPVELIPGMLEEIPKKEVQADGTVSYLCRLKRGIHFHDDPCFPGGKGREVVASDVHYVFQRLADPKVESPFFAPLEQRIVGLHEARETGIAKTGKFDYATPVSGFEVIDNYTFRLHLTGPFPQILYWMAMPCSLSPVAREAVEYYDGQSHEGKLRPLFRFYTVGTGPFRMREYTPRRRARYERVDGYHTNVFPSDGFPPAKAEWLQQFAGKPLPLFDELSILIVAETIPAFVLGRQGYLDGITANKDAFAAIVTADQKLTPKYAARGMELEKCGLPGTFYITFNMQDPVVGKNVKLRKALSCACDMRAYVQIFYSGVAPVANQLIPRGLFGYDPHYVNPNGYDLEKAKRLLAEAGYPDGRDARTGEQLVLTLNESVESTEMRQRAEYEQRMLEVLGIKVKINEMTAARALEAMEQGNFQFDSGTGWAMDYPDPENFFMIFYSKNFPREGANYCRYSRPEFDRAYEQMATMDDGPERLALIEKMNAMLAEDCPAIWEFDKAFYIATQPWARWTHNSPMIEYGFNKYQQVDPVLRKKLRRDWNRKPLWPLFILGALLAAGLIYAVRWNRRNHV